VRCIAALLYFYAMEKQELYDKLTELTEGLLYISETEGEFSVYEVDSEDEGNINAIMEDIASEPAVSFREENASIFFERVVASLDVADNVMQHFKVQYTTLFNFLQANFDHIKVLQAGEVNLDIFVVCSSKVNGTYMLHTSAVES
jgi:hypothetical protein